MGNICRSPSAEGVFRRVVESQQGLTIHVDSAGTRAYHVGEPPDRRAIEAAKRRGIDIGNLQARLVEEQDFERFDLILAMDRDNLQELRQRAPAHTHQRIQLIMDYAPDAHSREVPDPYYGGAKGFEEVLDLLEQAAAGLMESVRRQ
jgi:protein-tyrosine phosphatase